MDPRNSLDNMADLEVDCLPRSKQMDRVQKMEELYNATRHDSGIGSMDFVSRSVSFKSHNDLDPICEPTGVTDSISDDLGKLRITKDENKPKHAEHMNADIDEGYYSKSITDTPLRSLDNVPVHENLSVYSRFPSEAIEAYTQDDDGDTQLHMAIIQLDENISMQLINLAWSPECLNLCNMMLQTPLHLAVITRQPKIVRRLMSAGAAVDVRDLNGNTPLHIATREGHQEIVAHLVKPVYYEETTENRYEIPYQRIPQDLEAKNYDGLTCIHLAAQGTHANIMNLLLQKGAKINAQDGKSGRTVLHYAAETGNRILLEFLLRCRKLELDSLTYGGLTPVDLAAGRKYGDVVGILQAHGADCTSLQLNSDEEDEDMIDDFCLAGEPLSLR